MKFTKDKNLVKTSNVAKEMKIHGMEKFEDRKDVKKKCTDRFRVEDRMAKTKYYSKNGKIIEKIGEPLLVFVENFY